MGRGAKGFGRYAVGFGFGRGGWSSRADRQCSQVEWVSFSVWRAGEKWEEEEQGVGTSLARGSRSVAMHGFVCSM